MATRRWGRHSHPPARFGLDNSVLYQSPVWGGFRFGAGYSFNVNGAEVAGSGNNIRAWFTGVVSLSAPSTRPLHTTSIEPPNNGITGSATTPAIFANASDSEVPADRRNVRFQVREVHRAYAKEDDVILQRRHWAVSPVAGEDADSWMFGVTVPLFGGSILASYQKRDGDIANVCLAAIPVGAGSCFTQVGAVITPVALTPREGDRKVWAIGYTYPLSRRTNLYISYSDSDGEKFYNSNATVDRKQYTVGMRHLF